MTHEEKARELAAAMVNADSLPAQLLGVRSIAAALAEAEECGRVAGWTQAKEMAAQRAHNCGHPMLAQLIRALSDPPAAGGSHD